MPQPQFGQQQRGVPVGHAGARPGAQARPGERLVELPAGGGVGRQPHQAEVGEVGDADALPSRQRVALPDREHPGQVDRGPLLDAADRLADGDPRQVEVAGQQRVEAAAAGGLGLELQADAGVAAAEVDDRVGHEVPHGGAAGGHPDRAALPVDQVPQAAQGQVQAGQTVGGRVPQDAPGGGGHHPARLALQQADTGLLLQPLHVLAHRGLGAAQLAGHRAERSGPAHRHEHPQVVKSHERHASNPQAGTGTWEANPRIDLPRPQAARS